MAGFSVSNVADLEVELSKSECVQDSIDNVACRCSHSYPHTSIAPIVFSGSEVAMILGFCEIEMIEVSLYIFFFAYPILSA